MRNLKFRFWDTTSKRMYSMAEVGEFTIEQVCRFYNTDDQYTKVMQSTGLTDKHGVEIYEGDIVQSYHFTDSKGKDRFINHIVEWSDKFNGWFMRNEHDKTRENGSIQSWVYMRANKDSIKVIGKVIGNIHGVKNEK